MYKAYVPIECHRCDFTTKRVRLLLRHPCKGNKQPEGGESEIRIVDVTGSSGNVSQVSLESLGCQESHESSNKSQEFQESHESSNKSQESQESREVKAALSKEEKVLRNLKKRERTKRKVAEIRAEAKVCLLLQNCLLLQICLF